RGLLLHVGEGGPQRPTLRGAERKARPARRHLVAQAAALRGRVQLRQRRRLERARQARLRLRRGAERYLADLHRVRALAAGQRRERQPEHGVGLAVVDRETLRTKAIRKRGDRARVQAGELLAVERTFEQERGGVAVRRVVGRGQFELRDDERRAR